MTEHTTTPAFLDEQVIAQNGAETGLDTDSVHALREFARRVSGNPQLRLVVSAAHHALFHTNTDFSEALQVADSAIGAEANILHALFVLDSLRLIKERHAVRGVSSSISMAVFNRHGGAWLREASAGGDIGSTLWIPGWLRTVASGDFYRLGRLEFVPTTLDVPLRVYRHVRTGDVVAVSEGGEHFSDEGVAVGPHTWTSSLLETEDAIVATPLSPYGVALRQLVRLPRDEWQIVLKRGDPILDLHIPEKEPLTIDALRDAHMQAIAFFDQHYPGFNFVAYLSDSWLFSPLLEEMLGPNSNIVRWQHECYLLPDDSEGADMLEFTFGSAHVDPATAPRDTRLRRALLDRIEQGQMLYCGRYLFLREDLGRFGSQPYRESSARAIERLTVPVP